MYFDVTPKGPLSDGLQPVQDRPSKGLLSNYAFLGMGEATFKSTASSPIQYAELVIDTQGAVILLNQFKHSNVPHRVELQRGNDPVVCPVKALEDFIFL